MLYSAQVQIRRSYNSFCTYSQHYTRIGIRDSAQLHIWLLLQTYDLSVQATALLSMLTILT